MENDKKLDVGHDRFSAGEYSAFSKVAGTVENAFAKSSVAVDTGASLASPDKKDKGRLSQQSQTGNASSLAASSVSDGGATPATAASLSELVEDARTKVDQGLRRAFEGMQANTTSAVQTSNDVPDLEHTKRLRTVLQIRLDAAQYWWRSASFVKEWAAGQADLGQAADGDEDQQVVRN